MATQRKVKVGGVKIMMEDALWTQKIFNGFRTMKSSDIKAFWNYKNDICKQLLPTQYLAQLYFTRHYALKSKYYTPVQSL